MHVFYIPGKESYFSGEFGFHVEAHLDLREI